MPESFYWWTKVAPQWIFLMLVQFPVMKTCLSIKFKMWAPRRAKKQKQKQTTIFITIFSWLSSLFFPIYVTHMWDFHLHITVFCLLYQLTIILKVHYFVHNTGEEGFWAFKKVYGVNYLRLFELLSAAYKSRVWRQFSLCSGCPLNNLI